jgi:hypothetical protein
VGLILNGTHQFLVYVDVVNLQAGNIGTIKKNREVLIEARKGVGLQVKSEKVYAHISSPEYRARS